MTTKNYTINFINNTITLNKKFAKEASRDINSEAYKTIRTLRADYPDYTFVQKSIAKKKNKKTYAKLTFEAMREHIIVRDGEGSTLLAQYDYLMEFYKTHAGRYAKVKAWYLEQYKDEYAEQGEEEAPVFPMEMVG